LLHALIGKQVLILCGPAAVIAIRLKAATLQPLGNWEGYQSKLTRLSRKTCLYWKHC